MKKELQKKLQKYIPLLYSIIVKNKLKRNKKIFQYFPYNKNVISNDMYLRIYV